MSKIQSHKPKNTSTPQDAADPSLDGKHTNETILKATTQLVSLYGCDGVSMRRVGQAVPIAQSVIYHYYADKDALLLAMYQRANRLLGEKRLTLPAQSSAHEQLRQLIFFQIENAELIIAVLKYYLHYREQFAQVGSGTLPEKSTLPVEEVLEFGKKTGEWRVKDVVVQSKVITHSINGYLLEYYPHMPSGDEATELVDGIVQFVEAALYKKS